MFLAFTGGGSISMALIRPGICGDKPEAYGHGVWGGAFGRADPAAEVAIGPVCNRPGLELVGDPRTAGLCRAIPGGDQPLWVQGRISWTVLRESG